jgi:hypothetical protein
VTWVTQKASFDGIGHVTITTGAITNVSQDINLFNGSTLWQVPFTFSGLGGGTHTIKITVTGNKNPSSSGPHIVVDAFKVCETTALSSSSMQYASAIPENVDTNEVGLLDWLRSLWEQLTAAVIESQPTAALTKGG